MTESNPEQIRCDGGKSDLRQVGPPCTTMTNRTFYMDVVFDHQGIQEGELVQTAGANALKGCPGMEVLEKKISDK